MPLVSILVPAYNVQNYISATIDSVINQTFQDWEMIVLDDCSSDSTYEIACAWQAKDSRVKVFKNEHNLGMLENWNKGIDLCHSLYFVKLDSDDLWYPTMLEKALEVLKRNNEVGLVFSRFEDINENGAVTKNAASLPEFARNKAFSCVSLVKQGPSKMLAYYIMLQGLSVMRREVFDKIGKYRFLLTKETQSATDTEFYFRIGAEYKIHCIDEVLYQYRVHPGSISVQQLRSFIAEKKNYEVKYCIIEHYYQKGLIEKKERNDFIKEINILYNFSYIADLKRTGQWGRMLRSFAKQIIKYPFATVGFYKRRAIQKWQNLKQT
jgi:glycosyltransferase involved in cell wall biosynthesis